MTLNQCPQKNVLNGIMFNGAAIKKNYPGIILESINMNTWEVSTCQLIKTTKNFLPKPLKHSDMNSWMLWYNGTSLPFSSCLLFSSLVLYCTLSYRNAPHWPSQSLRIWASGGQQHMDWHITTYMWWQMFVCTSKQNVYVIL